MGKTLDGEPRALGEGDVASKLDKTVPWPDFGQALYVREINQVFGRLFAVIHENYQIRPAGNEDTTLSKIGLVLEGFS